MADSRKLGDVIFQSQAIVDDLEKVLGGSSLVTSKMTYYQTVEELKNKFKEVVEAKNQDEETKQYLAALAWREFSKIDLQKEVNESFKAKMEYYFVKTNAAHFKNSQRLMQEATDILNRFAPDYLHRYFGFVRPSIQQRTKNQVAKIYNLVEQLIKGNHPYDEIANSHIFLGIIPTIESLEEIEKIAKSRGKGVTVVSIVDYFEFTSETPIAGKPFSPKDCQTHGYHNYHLPMTDYTPDMEMENIINAAKAIHEAKLRGDVVYIHCKAGKARSAMVLSVYFALYDQDFRNQNKDVLDKPHILLRRAVNHIKASRKQVDLHDELLDALAGSNATEADREKQWEKLADPKQRQELEEKLGIGKLCNAYQAIAYGIELEKKQTLANKAQTPTDYSYHGEHFLKALVQTAAYKELVLFDWEIQKKSAVLSAIFEKAMGWKGFGLPRRLNYLDGFIDSLRTNPEKAVKELLADKQAMQDLSNIDKLESNSKAAYIIDIIERMRVGVLHYNVFHVFEPTIIDKVRVLVSDAKAIELENALKSTALYGYLSQNSEVQKSFNDLINFCKQRSNPQIQTALTQLLEIQHGTNNLKWLLNLEQACAIYQLYEVRPKAYNENVSYRDEALLRTGTPFGALLSALNPANPQDKKIIDQILAMQTTCLKELDQYCGLKNVLTQPLDLISLSPSSPRNANIIIPDTTNPSSSAQISSVLLTSTPTVPPSRPTKDAPELPAKADMMTPSVSSIPTGSPIHTSSAPVESGKKAPPPRPSAPAPGQKKS